MAIVRTSEHRHDGCTLDMRVSPLIGPELYVQIVESVAYTQKFIIQPLPDRLIVTQRQFASLNNWTQQMEHTTDRYMVTPHNAMEVTIDREVDNVQEVEEAMSLTEAIKNAEAEQDTNRTDG